MGENDDLYLKKFGKKLEALKKASGLSYRKIAANCNVEHSDIKRYVDGKINPTLLSIIDLAKGLGVEPKELLDIKWEDREQKNNPRFSVCFFNQYNLNSFVSDMSE